jgi:glycerophosphoryl diester phosphodiesterase
LNRTTVTAHAGCMSTPMDSMESVMAGIHAGADICEVDVNSLADGTPVLKHFDILPGESGLVKLTDVFGFIKDKSIALNLDIKAFDVIDHVIADVKEFNLENRVLITGIGAECAKQLHDRSCGIGYYLNYNFLPETEADEGTISLLIETVKALGCIGINSNYYNCTMETVEKLHSAGLQVSVWTVDDAENMVSLANMGVDNITTHFPDVLLGVLE